MQDITGVEKLTEREKVCLREWLQHKSAKEIAIDLGITHHAVEKRLKMARLKLNVGSSLEAARILAAYEDYGRTTSHSPDLSPNPAQRPSLVSRLIAWRAIAVGCLAAALLILAFTSEDPAGLGTEANRIEKVYDEQLTAHLDALIAAAEIGPDGEIFLTRPMGDSRFIEPGSGFYWQISADDREDFTSRSLRSRTLDVLPNGGKHEAVISDSSQFADEKLRMIQRTVRMPGSNADWTFIVARHIDEPD
ncbi:two-component signal transduction histidine kinase [Erythrobacter litoralis HTCC2594]|uniref:Two-component signal transduction histidine kinase n=2 Tax=Erythrobacter litoralis TaxID=39960 RepID=Q2NCQ7_ERYLH|nr:two-component signal transduction histidine kinase [Erythrobacter litoralis HTCC2594]